jgi:hypothetical protein
MNAIAQRGHASKVLRGSFSSQFNNLGELLRLFERLCMCATDASSVHQQKHDKCSKRDCHNAADDDAD